MGNNIYDRCTNVAMVHYVRLLVALTLAGLFAVVGLSDEHAWSEYALMNHPTGPNETAPFMVFLSMSKAKIEHPSIPANDTTPFYKQWDTFECTDNSITESLKNTTFEDTCTSVHTSYTAAYVLLASSCVLLALLAFAGEGEGIDLTEKTTRQAMLLIVALMVGTMVTAVCTIVFFNKMNRDMNKDMPGELNGVEKADYDPTYGWPYWLFIIALIVGPALFCGYVGYHVGYQKKPYGTLYEYALYPL